MIELSNEHPQYKVFLLLKVPVREAIYHFFRSPWWADFKTSLYNTWQFAKHNGWMATWNLIIDLGDPYGETNAFQVKSVLMHKTTARALYTYEYIVVDWWINRWAS